MITAHLRGHRVRYVLGIWYYLDNGMPFNLKRSCKRCCLEALPGGEDACLGHLPGVVSACCGHGVEKPYQVRVNNEI